MNHKNVVKKKMLIVIRYGRDHYKTEQMCDRAVGNYRHVFKLVLDSYMIQTMCEKAVNT